jgi:glycolate oxidase FAD binding subunit
MIAAALERVADRYRIEPTPEMPADAFVAAPPDLEGAAEILEAASAARSPVALWGGGTHQGMGYPVDLGFILSTARLTGVVDWQPDDLTVVVEAGVTLDVLDELLADRNQSAVLPEHDGGATVGGVIAAGLSGHRRLRYGPTRDRVLESTVVTGDGRIATAGGRVVKNVTGFDIPRLVTGSYGSLGLIGRVCLKLWPMPEASLTVPVPDARAAFDATFQPLAVLEDGDSARVFLSGTESEVEAKAADLGAAGEVGLRWPGDPTGDWQAVLRVPPARVADAVRRLRQLGGIEFLAAHGVGEVRIGASNAAAVAFGDVRSWAEAAGGALVVVARPPGESLFDPWGTPPQTLALQRRVKAAFDPAGIVNAGRLPGRI